MKTLGELLKPIGLALRKSRRDQSGGVTTNHYKVDEAKLAPDAVYNVITPVPSLIWIEPE